MDQHHRIDGSDFVWDTDKAAANQRKHGIRFQDAAIVFTDPLFVLTDASRNDEARDAVIGFDQSGRLLFVVHIALEGECIRITPRDWSSLPRSPCMLNEKLKKRMVKDRPVTSITLRIPVDVVDSLKTVAPHKGYAGYQTLLKSYISEGLRRDEAIYTSDAVERLARALKKRGVSGKVLDEAMRDVSV